MSTTDTVQKIATGTIGGGRRKPFVEGTPEQIREDHRERAREIMVEAARAKPWVEVDPETLERAGRGYLLSDEYDVVLERMTAAVGAAATRGTN